MHEWVVDADRLEIVRGIQHPFRFCGHSQRRQFEILIVVIGPLQCVLLLGQSGTARATDLNAAARGEVGFSDDACDPVLRLEQRQGHYRVGTLIGGLPKGTDDQERQIGAELLNVGVRDVLEQISPGVGSLDRPSRRYKYRRVVFGVDRSRQVIGPEGTGPQHERVVRHQHQGLGVGKPVGERGDAAIQRVADQRIRSGLRQGQSEGQVQFGIRNEPAILRKQNRRSKADSRDGIGSTGCRCRQESALRGVTVGASIGDVGRSGRIFGGEGIDGDTVGCAQSEILALALEFKIGMEAVGDAGSVFARSEHH